MKHILTQKYILITAILILTLTNTIHAQVAKNGFELPEGATARLGNGSIFHMQYTQDGTRLALTTSIGIWLYDTINFTPIYLLKKHENDAIYLAFSPDGSILATAEHPGVIHIWETDSGEHKHELMNEGGVNHIIFSNDGEKLGALGVDGSIRFWDTITWEEIAVYPDLVHLHKQNIRGLDLSSNSFLLALGDVNGKISVMEPISGKEIQTYNQHNGLVVDVKFSTDDELLASAGGVDNTIHVRDNLSAELKLSIENQPGADKLTFSPDNSHIAYRIYTGDIILRDVQSGQQRQVFKGHKRRVVDIAFSSDMRTLASASEDGTVRIWNVFTGEQLHVFKDHFGRYTCFDVSADGKTVAMPFSYPPIACLWDITSGKLDKSMHIDVSNIVYDTAFNPAGDIIAAACYSENISLLKRDTGSLQKNMEGHDAFVSTIDFSLDGQLLASGSSDKTVRLWDAITMEEKHVLKGHKLGIRCVTFSPDGTTIASGSQDKTVRLWDANTGAENMVFDKHESDVLRVAFSPDGATMASVANTPEIYLWDADTGEPKKVIDGDNSGVTSVVFHPDGKVFATGGQSGVIQLFDANSGESVRKFLGHWMKVKDLRFTTDGNKLVSLCDNGILYVWDTRLNQNKQDF